MKKYLCMLTAKPEGRDYAYAGVHTDGTVMAEIPNTSGARNIEAFNTEGEALFMLQEIKRIDFEDSNVQENLWEYYVEPWEDNAWMPTRNT